MAPNSTSAPAAQSFRIRILYPCDLSAYSCDLSALPVWIQDNVATSPLRVHLSASLTCTSYSPLLWYHPTHKHSQECPSPGCSQFSDMTQRHPLEPGGCHWHQSPWKWTAWQTTTRAKWGPKPNIGWGHLPLTGAAKADAHGVRQDWNEGVRTECLPPSAPTSCSADPGLDKKSFNGQWSLTTKTFPPNLVGISPLQIDDFTHTVLQTAGVGSGVQGLTDGKSPLSLSSLLFQISLSFILWGSFLPPPPPHY